MDKDLVEGIERATFAAVPPQSLLEMDGWLAGLDDGSVGRAHSVVPLRHTAVRMPDWARIEAAYAARGLRPVFRVPASPAFEPVRGALRHRGFALQQPTCTQVAELAEVATPDPAFAVQLADTPDEAWADLFLGPDFKPEEAAGRLGILRRARDARFASVRIEGRCVAVGVGCMAGPWCGMHGMRTASPWRGRGLAGALLAALARDALPRGAHRAFLQVESDNAAAHAAYRRAGFANAWTYAYWRRTA